MSAPIEDRRLYFLLASGQRRVQRWVEAEMARDGGLTAAQSGVLFVLAGSDGALIGEAAEAVDIAPSAMTGLVDRMERAGLVERRPDAADGRAQRLWLTDRGREALARTRAGVEALNRRLAEDFSEADLAVVSRWLKGLAAKFPRGE
ncbi:MarR family transcriptional regulator [Caulobacter sp. CCUG 60055]|uniref:MarR family winged helix-turn-helix transcriptional regulator n=1 Tax=Caulobacter sp. CCUG 60055 TaxID=2100090 RepID=UPI001FA73C35|nr:MarR family winged helix-turn-helix transcriptional regulator [Caulobacter sp. CCUG 60055]MBQ1543844.1 winged helix-turn-helix transcriptional regulator [Caulobacteraceae bacterium]MCI3180694.1 MarR family transcriptional regulator [Caulobacter sp. CCUG 60055]